MDKKMKFKYFYGAEADQFSFYRIPKALFTDSYFKDLSSDAKILYGLMLDRMSVRLVVVQTLMWDKSCIRTKIDG